MTVRPPKQIWIGRPLERRLEVDAATGEDGERLRPTPQAARTGRRRRLRGCSKTSPASAGVHKPQAPRARALSIGPGGVKRPRGRRSARRSCARPQRARRSNIRPRPAQGCRAAAAPRRRAGRPLLPTQAVFRQKAWLPWWLAIVVAAARAARRCCCSCCCPRTSTVPERGRQAVGVRRRAERHRGRARARAAGQGEGRPPTPSRARVLEQTPEAGEKAEKDSEVSVLRRRRRRQGRRCPTSSGKTSPTPRRRCATRKLTLGQATPAAARPARPRSRARSRRAGEVVKEGTAGRHLPVVPKPDAKAGAKDGDKERRRRRRPAAAGGGGRRRADIVIPADRRRRSPTSTPRRSPTSSLVPEGADGVQRRRAKGTLVRVDPEPGQKAKEGATVTLLVSAGIPQVAFDNDKDILLRQRRQRQADRRPIAQGPGAREGPDVQPRRQRASRSRATARSSCATSPSPTRRPSALTSEGEQFADLAWAPTADANVLAMVSARATTARRRPPVLRPRSRATA